MDTFLSLNWSLDNKLILLTLCHFLILFNLIMDSNIAFYHEDGRGNIYDGEGNDEAPSFRLKELTGLKKLIRNNTYAELHPVEVVDVDMKEAAAKKERETGCNLYSEKDRLLYLYFVFEKGMKHRDMSKNYRPAPF